MDIILIKFEPLSWFDGHETSSDIGQLNFFTTKCRHRTWDIFFRWTRTWLAPFYRRFSYGLRHIENYVQRKKSVFFWDQSLVSQNRTILHSLTLTHSDHRGALQKSAQFWLSTSGSRQVTRFFVTIWLGWWHWFVWFRTRVAIKSESHVPHSPQLYVGFKHVLHRYTTLVNQTILLHWVNY